MEKYGFIYVWYDRKHKRYYVGSHWGTEDDGYICSSNWMKQGYSHRPKDFKRRIIARIYSSKKDLLIEENRWLSMIKSEEIKVRYYNLRICEFGHWSADKNLEQSTKQRISQKTKEAMQRPEVREKYLNGLNTRDNRSSDLEVRAKRSKSMMGKNAGKDTSKAVEAARLVNTGRNISDDHKTKIAAAGVFKSMNNKRIHCKYCGVEGNPGNIGRYHNSKCKSINSLSFTG
jgi:hypothetical protein